MVSSEEFQRGVIQRLQAQRQAVDAGVGQGSEAGGFRIGGIGFQADFQVGGGRP